MMGLNVLTIALIFIASTASRGYANHERFTVGAMRNVDPSEKIITSTSGACVPSHDRERLECYFTSFGLWKTKTEEEVKKNWEQFSQEMNKDSAKYIKELKKSICDDKKMMQPDPIRLKYNVLYKTMAISIKAFCEHPTRDSALSFLRTMTEIDAKKCHCVVTDWRSTFVRQIDRWVANEGPAGLCGVIKVFTLVPHDLKKMKDPTGPVLWTLHEKTVTTHRADDPLCANPTKNPLIPTIEEGATTVSWNAASKSIDCGEFEFTSALEGMSDPRGPRGK
jgi:hypothetical protein